MSMMQHSPHMFDLTFLSCPLHKQGCPICRIGGTPKVLSLPPHNARAGQIIEMSEQLAIPIRLEMGISAPPPAI